MAKKGFVAGALALAAVIAATALVSCDDGSGGDDTGNSVTISSLDKLADTLAKLKDNEEGPYTLVFPKTVNVSGDDWGLINSTVTGRYVILDLSACSADGNTVEGAKTPTGNQFNIIKDNEYIRGVILPKSLTSIGNYALYECYYLEDVTIPKGVTSIGDYALCWSVGLQDLTIPEGVTSIGSYAFYGNLLSSVTIPASVTTIGSYAFHSRNSSFSSLTSTVSRVTFEGSETSVDSSAFDYDVASLSSVYAEGGAGTYRLVDNGFGYFHWRKVE